MPTTDVLNQRSAAAMAADAGPGQVRVDVLARSATPGGAYPVALRVARVDGGGPGAVHLSVDYSRFRHAYGGDWDSRLRLYLLPACALSTPNTAACAQRQDLGAVNDMRTGLLSADVNLTPAAGSSQLATDKGAGVDPDGGLAALQAQAVVALLSGPSSESGDYTKTSFHDTAMWQSGKAGGEFTYSYPMRVPPAPGGLIPTVAWNYSSGAVDGQTVGQNVQPFYGEGWDGTQGGYIERAYRPCTQDQANGPYYTVEDNNADVCWRLPNARMVLGGKAVELIYDDATGKWHTSDDDGAKVELLTGGVENYVWANERWRITTVDGTQYNFGLNRLPGFQSGDRETGSAWGAPVFGNHAGEPCFNAGGFGISWCMPAYRWNLDYVVDRLGNTMSYWYSQELNKTGKAADPWNVNDYVRGGTLDRIEYGTRAGTGATRESSPTAHPPVQVVFISGARCTTASCGTHDRDNYPDTPWDLECAAAP